MKQRHLILPLFSFLFITACQDKKVSQYTLNENFDSNEIGWIEESTSSHYTEIRNGAYYVYSKSEDTSKTQTSVSPFRVLFLLNLPGKYEITSSIKRIRENPEMEYGIELISASLSYRFALEKSGRILVTEYDYNTEAEDTLIQGDYLKIKELQRPDVTFNINVNDRDLRLLLNDISIGTCKIKTRQWQDIRLFTSTNSEIAVDYLRVKKLE
jgi:hypothetical protein